MDVSFVLSADEIFTLISLMPNRTEVGKEFVKKALPGAELCDLSGLAEKKLARIEGEELGLSPVIQMVIDAISNADHIEKSNDHWEVYSNWINLRCETYPYKEGHWKLTPLKDS